MAILTFPDVPIASVTWKQISNTQTFRSPLTGSSQTLELPGARWAAEISFTTLGAADKRRLSAFLVALRGSAGRFYLSEPQNETPSGSVNGEPIVDLSVSNTPTLIGTSGWVASAPGVFKAGDMIGFSTGEMKMVVADVDADASGQAIIQVEPPCRNQPGDGTSIVTAAPTCIMRLIDDNQASWQLSSPTRYKISISCEEAIV